MALVLSREGLQNPEWEDVGVDVSVEKILAKFYRDMEAPRWAHIGVGNMAYAMVGAIAQQIRVPILGLEVLNKGIVDFSGKYDNLRLRVVMPPNGKMEIEVIGSIRNILYANPEGHWSETLAATAQPSLEVISATITEHGYKLNDPKGDGAADLESGPSSPRSTIGKIAAMLYNRFQKGAAPVTMMSVDNVTGNGDVFREGVMTMARSWQEKKKIDGNFVGYLESRVTFPITMIDRITPGPYRAIQSILESMGIKDMVIEGAEGVSGLAPWINTEGPYSWLVIEDKFAAGRPTFEQAHRGPFDNVYVVPREVVEAMEAVKLETCLNKNHTLFALAGMLLGHDRVFDAFADPLLRKWVMDMFEYEGEPRVKDPKLISPRAFFNQVVERFDNRYIQDQCSRIGFLTSQKLYPRVVKTVESWGDEAHTLVLNPLELASAFRYWAGVNGSGRDFYGYRDTTGKVPIAFDPLLIELAGGHPISRLNVSEKPSYSEVRGAVAPLLARDDIFGKDFGRFGLTDRIVAMAYEMMQGQGAYRDTVRRYVMRK